MSQFHSTTPFPLLSEGSYSYADAQAHAARADRWLGLQTEETELVLSQRGCLARAPNSSKDHQQLWIGLAVQNLLTPYLEIRRILNRLKLRSGETVVDLGAAYGRMGFIIGRHYPETQFVGYEYVGERLREGQKCISKFKYPNIRLEHADLSSPNFKPETAEYYFIYDYGMPKAIEKTLHDLRRISETKKITIVARGNACQGAIVSRHRWLKRIEISEPNGRSSIYSS